MPELQIIHVQNQKGEKIGFVEGRLEDVKQDIRQTFMKRKGWEPHFIARHVGGRRYVLKVITSGKAIPVKPPKVPLKKIDIEHVMMQFWRGGPQPFPLITWTTPDYIRYKRGWKIKVHVNILKIKYPALISYGTAVQGYTGERVKWWKILVGDTPVVITEEGKDLPDDVK